MQPEDKSTVTRREFIQSTATKTLAATAIGSGLLALTKSVSAVNLDENEFDYIVVGTGAGGGPLACNLAIAGHSVLLLEAGSDHECDKYKVPVFHGLATEDPRMSWEFYVKHYSNPESQKLDSKYVADKGGVLYPRAATVGGCTAHNAMITMYPDNEDWAYIAKLTGDRSWAPSGMRQYFQRVEDCRYVKRTTENPEKRGYHGWLTTEQTSPLVALKDKRLFNLILAAAEEDGIAKEIYEKLVSQNGNVLLDPNSWSYLKRKMNGLFNVPKATKNGARNGTRERIQDTLARYPHRLKLRTNSLASKLIFSEISPNQVVGVEYLSGSHLYKADPNHNIAYTGVPKFVKAKKEVILAGGAFNSPQLLMLSGIGDKYQLEKMGIEPRIHLPGVGKNLQDRYEVGVVSEMGPDLSILKNCLFGDKNDPCLQDYKVDPKKSIYSSNGVLISLIRKSHSWKPTPDLCIFGVPGHFKGYYPGWSKDALVKNHFTWCILKGHTKNTAGHVSLKSKDPKDTPEIEFKYFNEGNDRFREDLDAVVSGLKYVRRINRKKVIRPLLKRELIPGPDVSSDEELRQFVTKEAWGHHASCSNKMGPQQDEQAVVGSDFKVHGVKGLRVVDASVFPKIPGLFIVAPTYMISEKASEAILKG